MFYTNVLIEDNMIYNAHTHGISVAERVPLKVGLNPLNARYLDTKAKKSGHIL